MDGIEGVDKECKYCTIDAQMMEVGKENEESGRLGQVKYIRDAGDKGTTELASSHVLLLPLHLPGNVLFTISRRLPFRME